MRFPRSSGILMPVFSLPNGSGIGDLGNGAYRFVDFLKSAGQSIWQLLPLGPPALGNSPYSSYSAFAGNPLLIGCDILLYDGLLTPEQLSEAGYFETVPEKNVDYHDVSRTRRPLLQEAFSTFQISAEEKMRSDFEDFCQVNAFWLDDFVLFDALASDFNKPDWSAWPADLVHRTPEAIADAKQRLSSAMQQARFEQFLFDRQWKALKEYANQQNIRIYGDMPIFVAYESADVWVNQDLFQLDNSGRPTVVAGVPPDYFSATGQMWGNPLYRWDRLAERDYDWWLKRLEQALQQFDILRLDHFRGFESYWEIPGDAPNAISGHWMPGPRDELFRVAQAHLGELPIVAEDLGLITDEVHHLRDRLGFPGMRVLQFGFEHHDDPYHRPDHFPEHSVAYTGTHDNETLMGWYGRRCQSDADPAMIAPFLSGDKNRVHLDLISAVASSAADTVIFPMQDVLGLNNDARINTPGLADGNWNWRCASDEPSPELAAELLHIATVANRVGET